MAEIEPVYYNEFDKQAATWLRELIKGGHIPPGDVDERSIEDVKPGDLRGYRQCHFFAGIGGWAHALDLAGWPADRPVWTGSCPCQPFSTAGKGAGFDDQRHLWPAWFHLIRECRPADVLGEQVASAAAGHWIDLVQADVEGVGYAFGSVAFPAAGVGAPHIRDRTYWVAYSRSGGLARPSRLSGGRISETGTARNSRAFGMANRDSDGREQGREVQPVCAEHHPQHGGSVVGLGHSHGERTGRISGALRGSEAGESGRGCGDDVVAPGSVDRPGPVNGRWRDADWLGCRDGKWRPVESGTFPLVDGIRGRMAVVRPASGTGAEEETIWIKRDAALKGAGNAIVPQAAAAFIAAAEESRIELLGREGRHQRG